ncbi:phosphatidylserine decarboxylase-domain-containing protein [Lipomyces kononenkoae]|uniref:Phosphatidylserine decarboxylase-domain-containing protein n=1 Tax=Lipomyces kononenkoae TaxID=34357 RepID=A0ACC3SZ59_LIPKO
MVLSNILGRRTAVTRSTTPSPSPSRSASPHPAPPEPTLILKIYVLKAKDLAALDRGGTSDPYGVIVLDDFKATTQAIHKTLNPEWNAVFDVPLYPAESEYMIEGTLWDKDRFSKEYLGSFDISVIEKFSDNEVKVIDNDENEPQWYPLYSARARKTYVKGGVYIKLALCCPLDPGATNEALLGKWKAMVSPDLDRVTPSLSDSEAVFDNSASSLENSDEESEAPSEPVADSTYLAVPGNTSRRRRLRLRRRRSYKPYHVGSLADVVGVVFFEIVKVTDLPPERNVTRTGFDMDPFVVVSFGKNVVRTGVQRHNLNPVYNEKVLFRILRHEQSYTFNITVIDRDSLSSNDFVAMASMPVQDILKFGPKPDPETGLYNLPLPQMRARSSGTSSSRRSRSRGSRSPSQMLSRPHTPLPSSDNSEKLSEAMKNASIATNESVDQSLATFNIPLILKHRARWEEKHSPEIQIRAKYVPYTALRQQFWKYLLLLYGNDESSMISRFEIDELLQYLGSTLHSSTVDSFFSRFGKSIDDDLTFDEAILCVEDQLHKDSSEPSKVVEHSVPVTTVPTEGGLLPRGEYESRADSSVQQEDNDSLADLGPWLKAMADDDYSCLDNELPTINTSEERPSEERSITSSDDSRIEQSIRSVEGVSAPPLESYADEIEEKTAEHIITIRECPVCHQPRLNKRSEVDIITHLATCASQDWQQVDLLAMNTYVTSDQARRKWVGNVASKLGYGNYRLGANSANILVQDRITGYISEERMSMYVRLGIRLLYQGLKSPQMERKRIRKLLASLSVKQGKKYDDVRSAKYIKPFIEFYQLDLSEILEPLEEFKTFNQFFYRKLRPGSRPCAAPSQPKIATSPADCRTVVFESIDKATEIWVKGREFSLERLFGAAYPEEVENFVGGAMGIFRLAPQDYHRFHIPVDGVLGRPKLIEGAYYTVNPMAIRSALDVYGENVRVLVPIDSDEFGRVMVVCVGAMMVGSTVITAKEGQRVSRTDELGYFQFGGSTLLLFFQPGKLEFDSDLVSNSKDSVETLIRVGMSIGHTPDEEEQLQKHRKVEEMSEKEKAEVARRIEGSLAPKVADY